MYVSNAHRHTCIYIPDDIAGVTPSSSVFAPPPPPPPFPANPDLRSNTVIHIQIIIFNTSEYSRNIW